MLMISKKLFAWNSEKIAFPGAVPDFQSGKSGTG
jgi:hypothetical protein